MKKLTFYQKKQVENITSIERQIRNNSLTFSTVSPVADFENDSRICLTSIHFPSKKLKTDILISIINPLKTMFPEHYYYAYDSLHMTIKNIRIIHNPPNFSGLDIKKAKEVLEEVIPTFSRFRVYFYRLLLFPSNLALVAVTDPELDKIIISLDKKLRDASIADDKIYANKKHFFSNMTLARFTKNVTKEFINEVDKLSRLVNFSPYRVDSVSLITGNAVLKKLDTIGTWQLK